MSGCEVYCICLSAIIIFDKYCQMWGLIEQKRGQLLLDENREISEFLYLVEKIVKSEFSHIFYYLSYDELFSFGLEGLWIGIRSYKHNVDKIIHYSRNIRFKIKREVVKSIEQAQRLEQHSLTRFDGTDRELISHRDDFISLDIDETLRVLFDSLSQQDKEVVNLLLIGYKQKEIAKKTGLTQQAISKKIKAIRVKIERQKKEG